MKIISALQYGFARSLKAWKGILIYWFLSLMMVSLVVIPLKASMKAGLGKSMITERLSGGLDIDTLGDLGSTLHSLTSSLFSGSIFLLLAGYLVGAFLLGGIFHSIGKDRENTDTGAFFKASAAHFGSYVLVMLLLYLIATILLSLVVGIPVSVMSQSGSGAEGSISKVVKISLLAAALVMAVLFLVADYARAWKAAGHEGSGFKALGYGFSQTFRAFGSSYPLMLVLSVLQILPLLLAYTVLAHWNPGDGMGVFLLFAGTQLLFILRIFLRVFRYASVTVLMELSPYVKAKKQTASINQEPVTAIIQEPVTAVSQEHVTGTAEVITDQPVNNDTDA